MRLHPTTVNLALACLIPACLALFATKRKFPRSYATSLVVLAVLDLIANLAGFGPFLWWSPLHWPSTFALGVDEIVEHHGIFVSTLGYLLDLMLWALVIALALAIRRLTARPPEAPEPL